MFWFSFNKSVYTHVCLFSGIGLRRLLENQLREAGVGSVPKTEFGDLCSNLLSSKSDSTVKKYNYSFQAWKNTVR